jgi:hypothetical protein
MWIDAHRHKLEGVDGEIHAFPGCSLVGLFEFWDLLADIELMMAVAPQGALKSELYVSEPKFRYAVNRCLELNGIKCEWVSWATVEELLFVRPGPKEGRLLEINRMEGDPGGKPVTLPELIGSLSTFEGFEAAVKLASNLPADLVMKVAKARNRAGQPEDKAQFDDWAERKRKEFASGRKP